ncbi:MAG: hypothetical protein RLZZ227_1777 [Pseudomonadota bacterium]|jgi:uncharacterized membrane protein YhaH (DUF805 family)
MNYDALFVNPIGRTSKAEFIPALVVVLAAIAFFAFMVGGRTAQFCMLVLLYPAFVLLSRRLRDMGHPGWLALVPATVALLAFGRVLDYYSLGAAVDSALPTAAFAVCAGFALWACAGRSK